MFLRRKSSKKDGASESGRRGAESSTSLKRSDSAYDGSSSKPSRSDDRERRKKLSRSHKKDDDDDSRSHYSAATEPPRRRSSPASKESRIRDPSPARRSKNSQSSRSDRAIPSSRSDIGPSTVPSGRTRDIPRKDSSQEPSSRAEKRAGKQRASRAVDDVPATPSGAASSEQNPDLRPNVPNQFPDQTPLYYSEPYLPPQTTYGAAAEFYGDQGESVAYQPGIRPATPIIVGAEPHLLPASAEPAPPEETGQGAAAEFFASSTADATLQSGTASLGNTQTVSPRISPTASPRPSKPTKISKPSRPDRISSGAAVGAVGAAAVTASALSHHHHDHTHHHDSSSVGMHTPSQQRPPRPIRPNHNMTQHHDHHEYIDPDDDKGPFDKFVSWWNDYEDVRRMEEYTEYIGVCKHCFDPRSSPAQAPRPHRLRKVSSRESVENLRVDKQRRYQTQGPERERRHKRNATWLAAGLGTYGVAKFFGAGSDSESSSEVHRRHRRATSQGLPRRSSREHTSAAISSISKPHSSQSYSEHATGVYARPTTSSNDVQQDAARLTNAAAVAGSSHAAQAQYRQTGGVSSLSTDANLPKRFDESRHQPSRTGREEVSLQTKQSPHTNRMRRKMSPPSSPSSSSSSEQNVGFFGRMFSTPQKRSRRTSSRKGRRHSDASSDSNLSRERKAMLGLDKRGSKSRPKRQERRSSDERAKTALVGLGAAAAALAAHEAGRSKKPGRDLPQNGLAPPPGRPSQIHSGSDDEDGWISDSQDSTGSADSALAFGTGSIGLHRSGHSSAESLSSAASGTDKWDWRWGPKKRRPSPSYQPGLPEPRQSRLTDDEGTPVDDGPKNQPKPPLDMRATSRKEQSRPLQYVDPRPVEDEDAARRFSLNNDPVPSPKPLIQSRADNVPLEQPQPIPPVQIPPVTSEPPAAPVRRVSFADFPKRPRYESDSDQGGHAVDYPPQQPSEEAKLTQTRRTSRPQKSPVPSPKLQYSTSDEADAPSDADEESRGRKQGAPNKGRSDSRNIAASTALAGAAAMALAGAGEKYRKRQMQSTEEPVALAKGSRDSIDDLSPKSETPGAFPTGQPVYPPVKDKADEETVSFPPLPTDPVNQDGDWEEALLSPDAVSDDSKPKNDSSIPASATMVVRRPKYSYNSDASDMEDSDDEKFNPDYFTTRARNARSDRETTQILADTRDKYSSTHTSSADFFAPAEISREHQQEKRDSGKVVIDHFSEGSASDAENVEGSRRSRGVPRLNLIAPTPPRSLSRASQRSPSTLRQRSPLRDGSGVENGVEKDDENESTEVAEPKGLADRAPSSQGKKDKVGSQDRQSSPAAPAQVDEESGTDPASHDFATQNATPYEELRSTNDYFYKQPYVQSVSDIGLKKESSSSFQQDVDLDPTSLPKSYQNDLNRSEAQQNSSTIPEQEAEDMDGFSSKTVKEKNKKARKSGGGMTNFASVASAVAGSAIGSAALSDSRSGPRQESAKFKDEPASEAISDARNDASESFKQRQTGDEKLTQQELTGWRSRDEKFDNHEIGSRMPGSFDDFEDERPGSKVTAPVTHAFGDDEQVKDGREAPPTKIEESQVTPGLVEEGQQLNDDWKTPTGSNKEKKKKSKSANKINGKQEDNFRSSNTPTGEDIRLAIDPLRDAKDGDDDWDTQVSSNKKKKKKSRVTFESLSDDEKIDDGSKMPVSNGKGPDAVDHARDDDLKYVESQTSSNGTKNTPMQSFPEDTHDKDQEWDIPVSGKKKKNSKALPQPAVERQQFDGRRKTLASEPITTGFVDDTQDNEQGRDDGWTAPGSSGKYEKSSGDSKQEDGWDVQPAGGKKSKQQKKREKQRSSIGFEDAPDEPSNYDLNKSGDYARVRDFHQDASRESPSISQRLARQDSGGVEYSQSEPPISRNTPNEPDEWSSKTSKKAKKAKRAEKASSGFGALDRLEGEDLAGQANERQSRWDQESDGAASKASAFLEERPAVSRDVDASLAAGFSKKERKKQEKKKKGQKLRWSEDTSEGRPEEDDTYKTSDWSEVSKSASRHEPDTLAQGTGTGTQHLADKVNQTHPLCAVERVLGQECLRYSQEIPSKDLVTVDDPPLELSRSRESSENEVERPVSPDAVDESAWQLQKESSPGLGSARSFPSGPRLSNAEHTMQEALPPKYSYTSSFDPSQIDPGESKADTAVSNIHTPVFEKPMSLDPRVNVSRMAFDLSAFATSYNPSSHESMNSEKDETHFVPAALPSFDKPQIQSSGPNVQSTRDDLSGRPSPCDVESTPTGSFIPAALPFFGARSASPAERALRRSLRTEPDAPSSDIVTRGAGLGISESREETAQHDLTETQTASPSFNPATLPFFGSSASEYTKTASQPGDDEDTSRNWHSAKSSVDTVAPQTPRARRQPSSTAIPLRFRLPTLSPGLARESQPQSPDVPTTSPDTPNRPRPARPTSTEFKNTKEFRPLYLVETNRKIAEPEESLPSLPSSHDTSRSPSIHSSDNDAWESALGSPNAPPSVQSDYFVPAMRTQSPDLGGDYLDSGQTTPRAATASGTSSQNQFHHFDEGPNNESIGDVTSRSEYESAKSQERGISDPFTKYATVVGGAVAVAAASSAFAYGDSSGYLVNEQKRQDQRLPEERSSTLPSEIEEQAVKNYDYDQEDYTSSGARQDSLKQSEVPLEHFDRHPFESNDEETRRVYQLEEGLNSTFQSVPEPAHRSTEDDHQIEEEVQSMEMSRDDQAELFNHGSSLSRLVAEDQDPQDDVQRLRELEDGLKYEDTETPPNFIAGTEHMHVASDNQRRDNTVGEIIPHSSYLHEYQIDDAELMEGHVPTASGVLEHASMPEEYADIMETPVMHRAIASEDTAVPMGIIASEEAASSRNVPLPEEPEVPEVDHFENDKSIRDIDDSDEVIALGKTTPSGMTRSVQQGTISKEGPGHKQTLGLGEQDIGFTKGTSDAGTRPDQQTISATDTTESRGMESPEKADDHRGTSTSNEAVATEYIVALEPSAEAKQLDDEWAMSGSNKKKLKKQKKREKKESMVTAEEEQPQEALVLDPQQEIKQLVDEWEPPASSSQKPKKQKKREKNNRLGLLDEPAANKSVSSEPQDNASQVAEVEDKPAIVGQALEEQKVLGNDSQPMAFEEQSESETAIPQASDEAKHDSTEWDMPTPTSKKSKKQKKREKNSQFNLSGEHTVNDLVAAEPSDTTPRIVEVEEKSAAIDVNPEEQKALQQDRSLRASDEQFQNETAIPEASADIKPEVDIWETSAPSRKKSKKQKKREKDITPISLDKPSLQDMPAVETSKEGGGVTEGVDQPKLVEGQTEEPERHDLDYQEAKSDEQPAAEILASETVEEPKQTSDHSVVSTNKSKKSKKQKKRERETVSSSTYEQSVHEMTPVEPSNEASEITNGSEISALVDEKSNGQETKEADTTVQINDQPKTTLTESEAVVDDWDTPAPSGKKSKKQKKRERETLTSSANEESTDNIDVAEPRDETSEAAQDLSNPVIQEETQRKASPIVVPDENPTVDTPIETKEVADDWTSLVTSGKKSKKQKKRDKPRKVATNEEEPPPNVAVDPFDGMNQHPEDFEVSTTADIQAEEAEKSTESELILGSYEPSAADVYKETKQTASDWEVSVTGGKKSKKQEKREKLGQSVEEQYSKEDEALETPPRTKDVDDWEMTLPNSKKSKKQKKREKERQETVAEEQTSTEADSNRKTPGAEPSQEISISEDYREVPAEEECRRLTSGEQAVRDGPSAEYPMSQFEAVAVQVNDDSNEPASGHQRSEQQQQHGKERSRSNVSDGQLPPEIDLPSKGPMTDPALEQMEVDRDVSKPSPDHREWEQQKQTTEELHLSDLEEQSTREIKPSTVEDVSGTALEPMPIDSHEQASVHDTETPQQRIDHQEGKAITSQQFDAAEDVDFVLPQDAMEIDNGWEHGASYGEQSKQLEQLESRGQATAAEEDTTENTGTLADDSKPERPQDTNQTDEWELPVTTGKKSKQQKKREKKARTALAQDSLPTDMVAPNEPPVVVSLDESKHIDSGIEEVVPADKKSKKQKKREDKKTSIAPSEPVLEEISTLTDAFNPEPADDIERMNNVDWQAPAKSGKKSKQQKKREKKKAAVAFNEPRNEAAALAETKEANFETQDRSRIADLDEAPMTLSEDKELVVEPDVNQSLTAAASSLAMEVDDLPTSGLERNALEQPDHLRSSDKVVDKAVAEPLPTDSGKVEEVEETTESEAGDKFQRLNAHPGTVSASITTDSLQSLAKAVSHKSISRDSNATFRDMNEAKLSQSLTDEARAPRMTDREEYIEDAPADVSVLESAEVSESIKEDAEESSTARAQKDSIEDPIPTRTGGEGPHRDDSGRIIALAENQGSVKHTTGGDFSDGRISMKQSHRPSLDDNHATKARDNVASLEAVFDFASPSKNETLESKANDSVAPESTSKSRASSLFISPPSQKTSSLSPDLQHDDSSKLEDESHEQAIKASAKGEMSNEEEEQEASHSPRTTQYDSPLHLRRQRSRPLDVITEASREVSPANVKDRKQIYEDDASDDSPADATQDQSGQLQAGSNDLRDERRWSESPGGSEVADTARAYARSPASALSETAGGDLIRPFSAMSNGSRAASINSNNRPETPTLRRIDDKLVSRSVSSDLRAANKRDADKVRALSAPSEANSAPPQQPSPTSPQPPVPADYEPLKGPGVKNTGKDRRQNMSDGGVFVSANNPFLAPYSSLNSCLQEAWGDAHGSPRSPTRPPSMRKRQSMQVMELQSRLDEALAENDSLRKARSTSRGYDGAEASADSLQQSLQARDIQVREMDLELKKLKASMQSLQVERDRVVEHNGQLKTQNDNLGADVNRRYAALQTERDDAQKNWQESARELEEVRHKHSRLTTGMEEIVRQEVTSALDGRNAEIRTLRAELEQANTGLQSLKQRATSEAYGSDYLNTRDEEYFDNACQQLFRTVQQWVLRFSKFSDNRRSRLSSEIHDENIEEKLDNAILDGTDVDEYLADRVRRRDVFMSIVMSMIWEFVFTRYLFGMDREQRQKLKSIEKLLSDVGPTRAVAHWRATTLCLLSRREAFFEQRSQDTDAVVHEIYSVLARLLPPPGHLAKQVQESLRNVMSLAIDLSIEMRTQRAEYIMLPPLRPDYDTNGDLTRKVYFNAALMNERSGEAASNEELEEQTATVRMVLFPLVVKRGDDQGETDDEIVVCPAQVLVSRARDERRERLSRTKSMQSVAPSIMDPASMV